MKYNFTRPSINVNFWLVSKDNLKTVYDFFVRKYSVKDVRFLLETKSGNNKNYDSFVEFENDLDEIKILKEKVTHINIGGSFCGETFTDRTHAWLNINFETDFNNNAIFNIMGEGKDNNKKDWIDGTYEEMTRLASSFEIKDEEIRKFLKKEYGGKYMESVVVEDFWEEKKNAIEKTIKEEKIITNNVNSEKEWYETWWGQVFIGLLALFIGTILLKIFRII